MSTTIGLLKYLLREVTGLGSADLTVGDLFATATRIPFKRPGVRSEQGATSLVSKTCHGGDSM